MLTREQGMELWHDIKRAAASGDKQAMQHAYAALVASGFNPFDWWGATCKN